jgi:hypothetical protein
MLRYRLLKSEYCLSYKILDWMAAFMVVFAVETLCFESRVLLCKVTRSGVHPTELQVSVSYQRGSHAWPRLLAQINACPIIGEYDKKGNKCLRTRTRHVDVHDAADARG